jgi:hypothetical protein
LVQFSVMKRKFDKEEKEEKSSKKKKIVEIIEPEKYELPIFLQYKFDPNEYLIQPEDELYFIPEGYAAYKDEVKDKFPEVYKYFQEEKQEKEFFECHVESIFKIF